MSAQQLEVRSGEVTLAVEIRGERTTAPPIVLVHGYPDTHTVWDGVAARLAEHRRVITYDVRGAGASTAPARTSGYRMNQLVADLLAVLDATAEGGPVHLVGHDWGSIQSWEAVTEPALRARFASFTSISGPCLDHVGHWMRAQRAGALANQLAKSWYVTAFHIPGASLIWRAVGDTWDERLLRLEGVAAKPGDRVGDGIRGVGLYRANMLRHVLRPRERRTDVPVQLIVPLRDHYVGHRLADGIERWASDVERRDVVATHWVPLSHPDLIAKLVGDHADKIDARAGATRASKPPRGPFAGKLAVVTGAGSGIGRATVFELLERGARVVAADLDLDSARTTAELGALLAGSPARVAPVRVDVADAAAMADFAALVAREHGVPDIVVNNAGIAVAGGFLATTAREWNRVLDVNLGGVVHGCRLFARMMLDDARPGHIINVASAAAFAPSRAMPAYATSKAAVVMLTECLRAELAGSGIRVGAVCPGFADTGITQATRFAGADAAREAKRRRATERAYRRRGMTGDDVARAIATAIERDEPLALVGVEAYGVHWLARLAPKLVRRLAKIDLAAGGAA